MSLELETLAIKSLVFRNLTDPAKSLRFSPLARRSVISICKVFGYFLVLLCSLSALAYPEFIAYGYSSCLTCHYNGQGGGPLNDYGRALWSAEIAARPFYSANVSDEDIANQSGFLGSTPLPYWLRPHVNYRGMDFRNNPGSGTSDTTLWLTMQEDFGVTMATEDPSQFLATATWGRVIQPQLYGLGSQGFTNVLAEEYYLRREIAPTWWLYVGLMEKVFGLRNVNHESYQRKYQGFQVYNNNQDGDAFSQGFVLHKVEDKWEATLNGFFGNPYDDSNYRQSGASALGELSVGENKRLGASVLKSSSPIKNKDMAAIHYRQQVSKGSSLMAEYGLIHDMPSGQFDSVGGYNLVEAVLFVTRGYNLIATTERYNQSFNPSVPDNWKWSFGVLAFPFARMEFRGEATLTRGISTQQVSQDLWSMTGQIHVSL